MDSNGNKRLDIVEYKCYFICNTLFAYLETTFFYNDTLSFYFYFVNNLQ